MQKRILIVEDEASIVELLTMVLSREGYELASRPVWHEAISMMKEFHPHLVLLDVMLPGLDGAGIVKIMSEDENLINIPVIITSALVESQRMFQMYPQVKAFCSKPFILTDLMAKVKKFIGDEDQPQ